MSDGVIIERDTINGIDRFVILEDGFVGLEGKNEYVQMDLRLLDGEGEGSGIAVSFSTDFMEYKGDYLPITLNKEELKQLLDYLTEAYKAL